MARVKSFRRYAQRIMSVRPQWQGAQGVNQVSILLEALDYRFSAVSIFDFVAKNALSIANACYLFFISKNRSNRCY